jgi:hypothetical protein
MAAVPVLFFLLHRRIPAAEFLRRMHLRKEWQIFDYERGQKSIRIDG